VLERGELQVSDMERKSEFETLFRDVVQVLVDKCVNPATGRPYTAGVLERALRDCHLALDPKRSAKQQALDALPKLAKEFPITRARMRFRVAAPVAAADALRAALAEQGAQVEGEETRNGVLTGAHTLLRAPRASSHALHSHAYTLSTRAQ
jgi:ribosome maturation protein SDO1